MNSLRFTGPSNGSALRSIVKQCADAGVACFVKATRRQANRPAALLVMWWHGRSHAQPRNRPRVWTVRLRRWLLQADRSQGRRHQRMAGGSARPTIPGSTGGDMTNEDKAFTRSDQPQPSSCTADQRVEDRDGLVRRAFDAGLRLGSKGEGWAPEDYDSAFADFVDGLL